MRLELILDERYKIISDKSRQNFILQRKDELINIKTKRPTGEYTWKDVGYYGHQFQWALTRYATEKIMDLDEVNVKGLERKLSEIEQTIIRKVKHENINLEK